MTLTVFPKTGRIPTIFSQEQLVLISHLEREPYAVLQADPEEDDILGHFFTVGLARFGLPELYTRHPFPAFCQTILNRFAEDHMVNRIKDDRFYSFEDITVPDENTEVRFTARNLSGAELYAAAEKINKTFQRALLTQYLDVYYAGVCQIFWPNEENFPTGSYSDDGKDTSGQLLSLMQVH
jgi:hypothetical protein